MSTLHIHRAKDQPATRYQVPGVHIVFTTKPRSLLYCSDCLLRRRAENLIVHAYYDVTYVFCAEGKGCRAKK